MNLDILIGSISNEAPCGVDLECDSDFARLELLFPGEQEIQMGDSVIEAQEPDWTEITSLCKSLLEKSKDLNLLVYLCVASLEVRGIPGLSESIRLLKDVTIRYWDHMYPQLDMSESEDQRYIERVNLLENLTKPYKSFGDPFKMVERIRNLLISDSKQVGRFSLAHMLAAKENRSMPDGSDAPTLALVEASFKSSDPQLLWEKAKAAEAIIIAIGELDDFLNRKLGTHNGVHLEYLRNEVEMLKKILNEFVPGASVTDNTGERSVGESDPVGMQSSENVVKSIPQSSGDLSESGEIRTRESIIRNIDRILAYYPKYEPGSPVPLLLRRAKRLVNLGFMQLIGDLSPSTKSDLEKLLGDDPEKKEDAK